MDERSSRGESVYVVASGQAQCVCHVVVYNGNGAHEASRPTRREWVGGGGGVGGDVWRGGGGGRACVSEH